MPTPLMVPNPAFFEDEVVKELVADQCLDQQTLWSCLPPESCVIPDEGTWIIVKDVPHTNLDFDVPLYSIWRARRHIRTRTFRLPTGPRGGKNEVHWPQMLAEIQTPGGDLVLYPTEYVTTDIQKWLDLINEGVELNFIGPGEPGELEDQLFYLQCRGIPRTQALLLLLPSLTDDRFVYLTLDLDGAT
jgi:hypothetical protein